MGARAIRLFSNVALVRAPIASVLLVGWTYRQTHVAHRELNMNGLKVDSTH